MVSLRGGFVVASLGILFAITALGAIAPAASACDEAAGTCFETDTEDDSGGEAGCEAHLVNRHLEAWVTCRINLAAAGDFVVAEDAPELSPEVSLRVDVIIQRMGSSGSDEPWGFRVEEGVPGVIIDGSAYQSGTLAAGETSTSFSFNLSADLSAGVDEAVVGIAFWDSDHNVQYERLGFTIDDGGFVFSTTWVAYIALILAIIALILAIIAMRRRVP